MAELPVSGDQFFRDFSFSLLEYQVMRSGKLVSTLKGMTNDENGENYIAFLYGAEIREGDVLISDETHVVRKVKVDTYHGKPEMIKAYY